MRRQWGAAFAVSAGLLASLVLADRARSAEVVVSIDKSSQSMVVLVDGVEQHKWVVSTGIGGGPHIGTYRPGRMERKWVSRKYNMAPMPYSIFFDGNYAIHGTAKISQLGRRASKGCVRLHPANAAMLFDLVRNQGVGNTTIVISNTTHVAARVVPVASPEGRKIASAEPAAAELVALSGDEPFTE